MDHHCLTTSSLNLLKAAAAAGAEAGDVSYVSLIHSSSNDSLMSNSTAGGVYKEHGGEGEEEDFYFLFVLYKLVVPISFGLISCVGAIGNILVIYVILSQVRYNTCYLIYVILSQALNNTYFVIYTSYSQRQATINTLLSTSNCHS